MSRRTVRIAVSAVALVFSGGLGLWTATAAPADELPPAVVAPSTSPTAPATTAPAPAAPAPAASASTTVTPVNRDGVVPCGLCAVPAP